MDAVHAGEEVVKFLVYGVGIGYIGRKFVADYLIRKGQKLINSTERNSAIFSHYQKQAIGSGHAAASVLDCSEDKCRVFGHVSTVATA